MNQFSHRMTRPGRETSTFVRKWSICMTTLRSGLNIFVLVITDNSN